MTDALTDLAMALHIHEPSSQGVRMDRPCGGCLGRAETVMAWIGERVDQARAVAAHADTYHRDHCGPLIDESVPVDSRILAALLSLLGQDDQS